MGHEIRCRFAKIFISLTRRRAVGKGKWEMGARGFSATFAMLRPVTGDGHAATALRSAPCASEQEP